MNVAISTFALFILLLPGIFFRRFYFSEEFSKEYFKQTFLEVFLSAFVPSLFFHSCWYFIVKPLGYNVDLIIFADLISSSPQNETLRNIEQFAGWIITYHLTMLLTASFAGHYFKKMVRIFKWDRKYKELRFQNSWHYILKGEFFDFPRSAFDLEVDTVERIEIVYVDAIVKIEEGSIIYDGILVDYELSNDGGLETISLKEVQRRYLKDDKSEVSFDHKYYTIPGHILILKHSEIINLNFSYYKIVEENGEYNAELVK